MKTPAGVALALAALQATAAEPASPASVLPDPRLSYRSAFDTPLLREASPADWRDSNELVRRLGGHAGHLRAAARTDATPAAQSATVPAATPPTPSPTPAATAPTHPHHGSHR